MNEDDRNALARKYAGERLNYQFRHKLRDAALENALAELKADTWNCIKQLRLDGLLYICEHVENLDLHTIAWLTFQQDLHIDFKLISQRDDGLTFTDIGMIKHDKPKRRKPRSLKQFSRQLQRSVAGISKHYGAFSN